MKNTLRKFSITFIAVILFIVTAVLSFISLAPTPVYAVKSVFENGDGTKDRPFLISTAKEFKAMATRLDAYFIQTEDIDFTGEKFNPIGDLLHPFTGHFSGKYNGKQSVITGIETELSDEDNVGVFSFVYDGAVVEDIRIEDSAFTGNQNVGAVAGINAGRIERAVVDAKITAKVNNAGGIAGLNSGIISLSVNSGEIKAKNMYAGGIAGSNTGKISDSYNKGKVSAYTYAGGIAGLNNGKSSDAVMERIFNVGEISGNVKAHIAGDNLSAVIKQGRYIEGRAPDCISAFNTGNVYASAARPNSEFNKKIAFSDWRDFDKNFMFVDGVEYPILRTEHIKVTEIRFNAGTTARLKPGEAIDVGAYVIPKRANRQKVNLSVDVGADSCTLSNGVIRINDSAEVGSFINILGEADGVYGLLRIEIEKIPVEQIEIATLNEKITVVPGGNLQFATKISPDNASVKEVKYSSSNPHFADVDVNGNLAVALDAPIGLSFKVSAASYDNIGIRSEMEITVVAAEVQSVVLTNELTDFKVTESLALTGRAVTESLETDKIEFEIDYEKTTAAGAKIVDGCLYAELPGEIYVVPKYEGVSGDMALFTALKEPVASIEILNINSFPINGALSLVAKVLPDDATFSEVTFSIVNENGIGAVLNGNILTAAKTGTVIIRAESDGVFATQTIYAEPAREEEVEIDDITLECAEFLVTRSLTLVAKISPSNAVSSVYYDVINDGGTCAVLENGVLKNAKQPGTIFIKAYTASFEKIIRVEALKVAVESVRFVSANRFKVTDNLLLSVVTIPTNPTNTQVSYEIIDEEKTGARIIDGVLYASRVGKIKIIATVDEIESAPYTVIIDKEPVTEVLFTSTSRSFKCTENLKLEAMALPVQATYKDVEFLIDENNTETNLKARITDNVLTAVAPGVVGVIMRCDGHDYPVVITVEKEPVTGVELQTRVISDNSSEKVFRTSGNLDLTAVVYPLNATYREVSISIIKCDDIGARLVESKVNNQQSTKDFSGESNKMSLYADKPGKITLRVASTDNANIFEDYEIEVFEEYVADIYLAMDKEVNKETFEAAQETLITKYDIDKNSHTTYSYCDDTYMKVKETLSFAVLAYASNRDVYPTYLEQFKLYYYTSLSNCLTDTGRQDLRESNPYVTIEDEVGCNLSLKASKNMGEIWVVAVSENGEYGEVISPAVKVTIYPSNINDLKSLGIDKNGVIKPYTNKNPKIDTMSGYEVSVKTNKFKYSTFVETQYTELQLKLYKYSLNITDVSVYAVFKQEGLVDFKFKIPMNIVTNTEENSTVVERSNELFKGIKALPKSQVVPIAQIGNYDDSQYSAVVLYDFYRTSYSFDTSLNFDKGVRSVYVYGNSGAMHSGIDFAFNYKQQADETEANSEGTNRKPQKVEITLNNVKFKANSNHDAIKFSDPVKLNLKIRGDVELYGGDGVDGKDGANGKTNNIPYSTARRSGTSLNGANYGDVQWNPFGKNPDGNPGEGGSDGEDGKAGERGEDGKNGGYGIRLSSENAFLVEDEKVNADGQEENNAETKIDIPNGATLKLVGGKGGNGCKGGNGENGQGGQNGGKGGNGGTKYCVVFDLGGKGGAGGKGGKGGNGGKGGDGGNAGCGGLGTNSKKILNETGVTSSIGNDGKVGSGGKGGAGGYGGEGGKGGRGGQGFYVAVVVPVTYTGDGGSNGDNGGNGEAGANGASGNLKMLSNLTDN